MAAYRAKRNIPGTNIRKGDKVDRTTAEKHGKGGFVAEGDDYRRDEQDKQNARRAEQRRRQRGG